MTEPFPTPHPVEPPEGGWPYVFTEGDGLHETRWACEPPAVGTTYRVIRDAWDFDAKPPVHWILGYEVVSER